MTGAIRPGVVQIAGVIDAVEARLLLDCGVRYLGFPLRLPVNREDLSEREAAAIIRDLPPDAHGVLITYLDRAVDIVELCRQLGARIVQVHGAIAATELARVKVVDPGLAVIKSLVVGLREPAVLQAEGERLAPWVDAFITDTFDPATGATGATGRTHDWSVSRRLVERLPRPVILAGGLTPDNVAEAIRAVRPAGVDAHTGVEDADGRKSRDKVTKFVAAARAAFAGLARR
jgi:phosphoribosylanthranilate isomerase